MYKRIKMVKVNSDYCDYLRKYDDKVAYNYGIKELRPYIGVLFVINDMEYFAPLSSPKEKHRRLYDSIDLIKIENGELGVINLNNMIPVTKNNYIEFNLNKKVNNKSDFLRIVLYKKQLRWLTVNRKDIYFKSSKLYFLYINNMLAKNIKNRCCNFKLLEEKCLEYNKELVS